MLDKILSVTSSHLFFVAGGILVLYLLSQIILDPLRDVPGPFLARFTRWWYFGEVYKGEYHLVNIRLHEKYGPLVRIAPGEYSIDDVDAVKTIYGMGTSFPKAAWYWAWMPPTSTERSLFSDQDPVHHASQRRKVASFFSMTTLYTYEAFVDNCISLFSARLGELASTGITFDFQHWLQCYAFDVIGEITFGRRFGFLDVGEDKEGVIAALDLKSVYCTLVGIFPWAHQYLYTLQPSTSGQRHIGAFAGTQISNRITELKDPKNADSEKPPDMMTKILLEHEKDPERMRKIDLFSTVQSNIGAGSDTISMSLASIFYQLIKHPATYKKLRDEIDTAAKAGEISDPVSFKESQKLPYLQAVISEGMRKHAAAGVTLSRVVPPEGTEILGKHIPGGATVGINPWVAHASTAHWGKDADEWRPERWLEYAEQGRTAEMERYYMPFGLGSRGCIGRNIGMLAMSKVVPQLVRQFDFDLDQEVAQNGLKSVTRLFVKQQNFNVRVQMRPRKV